MTALPDEHGENIDAIYIFVCRLADRKYDFFIVRCSLPEYARYLFTKETTSLESSENHSYRKLLQPINRPTGERLAANGQQCCSSPPAVTASLSPRQKPNSRSFPPSSRFVLIQTKAPSQFGWELLWPA